MKKETLIGFAILLAGFWFFNSEIYYKMIGQPYPFNQQVQQTQKITVLPDTVLSEKKSVTEIVIKEEAKNDSLEYGDDSDTSDSAEIAEILPAKEIVLSNDVLQLIISEDGAKIVSAKTLRYFYGKGLKKVGDTVELISDKEAGILTSATSGADLSDARFIYDEENSTPNFAIFTHNLNGEEVRKTFELSENSYYVKFRMQSNLLKKETSVIYLNAGINESETNDNRSIPYSERYVSFSDENHKTERITLKKAEVRENTGRIGWVSLNSKYFTFAVIPQDQNNRHLIITSDLVDNTAKIEPINFNYKIELAKNAQRNAENDDFVEYSVFIGPAKHSDLTQAKVGLERTLFRGYAWFFGANLWFPPLCEGVLWFLNFFGKLVGDYGVSIILLTLLLKIVTYPLSQSSMNAMAQMQVLQPKIQEIQKKYKDNRQLQQQKILELYQSEGINPLASLGGCIPLLIQMPIMIALFIVLRKAVELRGEITFFLPWVHDLSQAEILFRLPFTIPFYGDNFAILPILMAGLMFIQNKMTIKDPNQVAMIYMMPAIMLVMFNNFPSGLTLYFTFSSLLQIIQQKFFTKKPVLAAKTQPVSVGTKKKK
ncbi:MAG: membrane protein insertase YidC [Chitinivibrionia bacterium]|nr:membrane protein insertase YidC [Chitinivibrionia bacterium]